MGSGNHLVYPNSKPPTAHHWQRRDFVKCVAALVGAAGLSAYDMRHASAEPPPETTKIRLIHAPAICIAPAFLAEAFLHSEGFSEVQYVNPEGTAGADLIATGRVDLSMWDIPSLITPLDGGKPIVVLGGIHAGCFELFGNDRVGSLRDLRGKTVAVSVIGGSEYVLLCSMVAYVGVNPRKEINWITGEKLRDAMTLFIDGKADAFLGFAPQPQELRAKKIGRVIVNTAQDHPWSQYFCCAVAANRDFVSTHPSATKRALRAILKATDVCASDPERVARYLVAKGYEPRYNIALEVLKALPYARWRQSNPEDTLRFHALRLHEFGIINSDPQKIIAQGTDWRFLNELKRELKA